MPLRGFADEYSQHTYFHGEIRDLSCKFLDKCILFRQVARKLFPCLWTCSIFLYFHNPVLGEFAKDIYQIYFLGLEPSCIVRPWKQSSLILKIKEQFWRVETWQNLSDFSNIMESAVFRRLDTSLKVIILSSMYLSSIS